MPCTKPGEERADRLARLPPQARTARAKLGLGVPTPPEQCSTAPRRAAREAPGRCAVRTRSAPGPAARRARPPPSRAAAASNESHAKTDAGVPAAHKRAMLRRSQAESGLSSSHSCACASARRRRPLPMRSRSRTRATRCSPPSRQTRRAGTARRSRSETSITTTGATCSCWARSWTPSTKHTRSTRRSRGWSRRQRVGCSVRRERAKKQATHDAPVPTPTE